MSYKLCLYFQLYLKLKNKHVFTAGSLQSTNISQTLCSQLKFGSNFVRKTKKSSDTYFLQKQLLTFKREIDASLLRVHILFPLVLCWCRLKTSQVHGLLQFHIIINQINPFAVGDTRTRGAEETLTRRFFTSVKRLSWSGSVNGFLKESLTDRKSVV